MEINTDPFDFAAKLKALVEKYPDMPKRELAERLGIAPQRVSDWLAMNRTIEPIRQLYYEKKIGRVICVRAGYLSPARQVNYIERVLGRRLVPLVEGQVHLLSLYIPKDGRNRHDRMIEKFGKPVAVQLHDEADSITGGTFTWRFADANQMMLATQDALAMGLMRELPRHTTAKVV